MSWKDDAPIMYVCISVIAGIGFGIAFIIAMRRQPHRCERVRRFLCCQNHPLETYTPVGEGDESERFVIGSDDEEVEVDLEMTQTTEIKSNPENIEAATV